MARLLYFTTGSVPPLMQVATYAMVDAILLVLIQAERKEHHAPRVYPAMLLAFILSQLPTFVFPGTSAWDAFAAWYAALPLP
jgi:L-aminopeptidase/D-esterase-like protein